MNKGQKLVKMVEMMQRREGVLASQLQQRFHLDSRSLRRYMADLREIGVPVWEQGRGSDRVLGIDARWRRTGVALTLTEVLSLHFGRTLFDFLQGSDLAGDLEGAIERLSPAISKTHRDLARHLDTKFLAVPEGRKDYAGEISEIIDEIITALVYNSPLDARYRRPSSSVEKRYRLHPYTLATFRQGLYLFALDHQAGVVKTFALERFTEVLRVRSERFEDPLGWRPKAHIAHAFGIISGLPADVAIAFDSFDAAFVRERTWHPTQTFRTLPDGRLELRMQVAPTIELEAWVMGFGESAQVLGPPELVQRVAQRLRKAAERYP